MTTLAALLFSERDTITAGEIANQLGASPRSVSTAIKSLEDEHFRFPGDGWGCLMPEQNTVVRIMQEAADEGIEAAGHG